MIYWRTDARLTSSSAFVRIKFNSVTHSAIASFATFLFLPHFDVICDLLLNRRTATWNLFVKHRADWAIYFTGERSLFCLSDTGSVRFMKKFEYNPSCFIPYNSGKISRWIWSDCPGSITKCTNLKILVRKCILSRPYSVYRLKVFESRLT